MAHVFSSQKIPIYQKNTNVPLCAGIVAKIKVRYNLHEALNAIMLRKQLLPMTSCDYQQQICSLLRKSIFICEGLKETY